MAREQSTDLRRLLDRIAYEFNQVHSVDGDVGNATARDVPIDVRAIREVDLVCDGRIAGRLCSRQPVCSPGALPIEMQSQPLAPHRSNARRMSPGVGAHELVVHLVHQEARLRSPPQHVIEPLVAQLSDDVDPCYWIYFVPSEIFCRITERVHDAALRLRMIVWPDE